MAPPSTGLSARFRQLSVLTRLLPYVVFAHVAPALTVAVLLGLLRFFVCKNYWEATDPSQVPVPNGPMCRIRSIDAQTSAVVAASSVLDSIVSLFSSSPLQRLADSWGRKPLLVGLALCGALSGLLLIAAQWVESLPVTLGLVFAYSILGTVAAKAAQYIPGMCVADTTTPEERTPAFTKVAAAAIGAMTVGFFGSSLISKLPSDSFILPFAISSGVFGLCALYAVVVIPETKPVSADVVPRPTSSTTPEPASRPSKAAGVLSTLLAPVYPLRLLWPGKREDGKRRNWNLLLLALTALLCGAVGGFVPSAIILYLSSEFGFQEEQSGYILAWFVGSRFLFLVLPFPVLLKAGRKRMHAWQIGHPIRQAVVVEAGARSDELTPLLPGIVPSPSDTVVNVAEVSIIEDPAALANHFDVIILVLSLWAEGAGYLCLYFARTWQQFAACFLLLSLGSGFGACIKSLFLASADEDRASECLAALDLVQNGALFISPIVMGSLSSAFIKANQPALLFLVAAATCTVAPIVLVPLRRV